MEVACIIILTAAYISYIEWKFEQSQKTEDELLKKINRMGEFESELFKENSVILYELLKIMKEKSIIEEDYRKVAEYDKALQQPRFKDI